MTISQALNVSERSVSIRDAEVLLHHALGKTREWLYAHADYSLNREEESTYRSFLDRREQNEPVAYILGYKEFYGRPFKVDPRVLIPRPETEALIDAALAWAPQYFTKHTAATNKPCPVRILELGTGSGNIATTLSLELAKGTTPAQIIATDISGEALTVAQENYAMLSERESHPLDNPVTWFESDLFAHQTLKKWAPYHMIVANLPYVPTTWRHDPEAQPDVIFYEPETALFGGEDGLLYFQTFFQEAPSFLHPEGIMLLEYGEDETPTLKRLAQQTFPDRPLTVHKDYAGLDRLLEIGPTSSAQ